MKKSIFTIVIALFTLTGFSQNIGIKLQSAQTFTVVPAHTQIADSIAILTTDWEDNAVYANIQFWKDGKAKEVMRLQLFNTFKPYSEATDAKIIARVKNRLNIP